MLDCCGNLLLLLLLHTFERIKAPGWIPERLPPPFPCPAFGEIGDGWCCFGASRVKWNGQPLAPFDDEVNCENLEVLPAGFDESPPFPGESLAFPGGFLGFLEELLEELLWRLPEVTPKAAGAPHPLLQFVEVLQVLLLEELLLLVEVRR